MKKDFVIPKKYLNPNLENRKFYIEEHIEKIIKNLLQSDEITIIKKDIVGNDYNVYLNDRKVLSFTINSSLHDHILSINKSDVLYEYFILEQKDKINLTLRNCYFNINDIKYNIMRYVNSLIISISNDNKRTILNLDLDYNNEQLVINSIVDISLEDDINIIYNKIKNKINMINDIKIEKYNMCNSTEVLTDLLIISDGNLVDYLNTIDRKNKKYIIKKDKDNYSITFYDTSIDGFDFKDSEIKEKINFVKKLIKK